MSSVPAALVAPWLPDSPDVVPYSLGQVVEVSALTPGGTRIPVQLESGVLSFDERRAPRCQVDLTARVPEDAATLALLDPRTGVRLQVSAGYLRPGIGAGLRDVFPVADLLLNDRPVRRPADTLTLSAGGQETAVLDAGGPAASVTYSGNLETAVRSVLTAALGTYTIGGVTMPAATLSAPVVVTAQQDWWAQLDDWLDREGADLYDDGLRRWWLTARPTLGTPAALLRPGAGGTLTGADTSLSRRDWHNAAQLIYRWNVTDTIQWASGRTEQITVERQVVGKAAVTAGPFTAGPGTRRTYREVRDVATTQAEANDAAAVVLGRRLASGRTVSVRAITCWWLRPGHTVQLQLPTGPSELLLVVAVRFDLTAGEMDVDVRSPDTASVITPGA